MVLHLTALHNCHSEKQWTTRNCETFPLGDKTIKYYGRPVDALVRLTSWPASSSKEPLAAIGYESLM